MLDRTDELELLAFIEGELDARQMAVVRMRLSNEPRALAMLDRMGEDRAALRAIGSPELPEDFVARLEPLLARPMLTEPITDATTSTFSKPGEFRRQYRRQVRMRWRRLAAAAVLFLGLLVGTWAAVNGLVGRDTGSGRDVRLALDDSAGEVATDAEPSPDELAVAALSGTIHHNRPDLSKPRELIAASAPLDRPSADRQPPVHGQPRVAEFAIVMTAGSAADAERSLVAALASPEAKTALVRNFSFAEARQLAEEWAVANGSQPAGSSAPHVASTTNPSRLSGADDYNVLADRVRQRLNATSGHGASTAAIPSDSVTQILGSADLAPTLEAQLDLSRRGASHTMTMPVSILSAVVERLALIDGAATSLRLMPSIEPGVTEINTNLLTANPLEAWVNEGPAVRQAMDRLLKESAEGVVQIPVIVSVVK